MNSLTRKLPNHVKNFKWCRKISSNAIKVDEFTLKSSSPTEPIPHVRLADRMWQNVSIFKDKVALVSAETKKAYTYDHLLKLPRIFATSLLKKLKLQSNDIVAIILPNCPEYPVVALGAIAAGCIISPINPAYKTFELSHQLNLVKPAAIVTTPEAHNTIVEALKNIKHQTKIVIIDSSNSPIPDGTIRYTELAESGETDSALLDNIEKSHDDIVCIPFSSGTTGLPKGVQITYENLLAGLENVLHEKIHLSFLPTDTRQDILPCVIPFFHIYGFVIPLLANLSFGCKLITFSHFQPDVYLNTLKNNKATVLFTVPPLLLFLAKNPAATKEHFKHLKFLVCGAAPLPGAEVAALLEKCNPNAKFIQGYGATETTSMGAMNYREDEYTNFSSCGDPAPNIVMRFADPETGAPVPIGEVGELLIKSPSVMKGYYQNDEATKECMTSDGFYKTGDSAIYKFGEGTFILDRFKELIKVKGMQVAPAELEGLIRTHPSVADAGVIGIPHEFNGQVPKAFVVLHKGKSATEDEIKDFVAKNVSDFKRVAEVVFLEGIPKNASGKILRKDLRKM